MCLSRHILLMLIEVVFHAELQSPALSEAVAVVPRVLEVVAGLLGKAIDGHSVLDACLGEQLVLAVALSGECGNLCDAPLRVQQVGDVVNVDDELQLVLGAAYLQVEVVGEAQVEAVSTIICLRGYSLRRAASMVSPSILGIRISVSTISG